MNVNGVGGAASLPVTLASSAPIAPPASAGTDGATVTGAGTTVTGTTGAATDQSRVPGQSRNTSETTADGAAKSQEAPKPAPLPPLRGLTVAEIRAMLGVAPLPGRTEEAASSAAAVTAATARNTSIISAALHRYA